MVGWDRTDAFVITSSSDHLLRVWDSRTGVLKRMLKGHEDNAYVIEAHPTDSRLILTAGHDGEFGLTVSKHSTVPSSGDDAGTGRGLLRAEATRARA